MFFVGNDDICPYTYQQMGIFVANNLIIVAGVVELNISFLNS